MSRVEEVRLGVCALRCAWRDGRVERACTAGSETIRRARQLLLCSITRKLARVDDDIPLLCRSTGRSRRNSRFALAFDVFEAFGKE